MFYVLLRTRDLVEAMAEINPNSSGRLPKPEFRKALQKLGYTLLDSEYEWGWDMCVWTTLGGTGVCEPLYRGWGGTCVCEPF